VGLAPWDATPGGVVGHVIGVLGMALGEVEGLSELPETFAELVELPNKSQTPLSTGETDI